MRVVVGRKGLDQGSCVSKGVQTSLVGQELLINHWVDGVGEAEGGTESERKKSLLNNLAKVLRKKILHKKCIC